MNVENRKEISRFKDFLSSIDSPLTKNISLFGHMSSAAYNKEPGYYIHENFIVFGTSLICVWGNNKLQWWSHDFIIMNNSESHLDQIEKMSNLNHIKEVSALEAMDIIEEKAPDVYEFLLYHLNLIR